MEEPLHVIWIAEGHVLNHTVHAIDVAFDLRGRSAGETLTQLLTAQVTESNGQGCIVHSSVFVQIFVVKDELSMAGSPRSPAIKRLPSHCGIAPPCTNIAPLGDASVLTFN
jgi:hypothetical protein